MLKRVFCTSLMVLAVMFAVAHMAMAYTITTGSSWGPYQAGSGGEFALQPGGGLNVLGYYGPDTKTATTFQSFCLETQEYINLNQTYTAFLNTKAIQGSNGAAGDTISVGTADLYWRFATENWAGTTASYNYTDTTTRLTDAALLQNAIWYLEGETTTVPVSNMYYTYVVNTFGTPTFNANLQGTGGAAADNNGQFPVMALNLYTSTGGLAQDQLVVVPIPPALWLLGSGLLGLAGIRRRFRK